jgi:hypothetical protein
MPDKQTVPDWRETVRERMDSDLLPSPDREEVISELAAHLEERYHEARSRGLNHATAVELTLREVEDWRVLATNICRAKSNIEEDPMNYNAKTLYLPALVSFASASLFLLAFTWISLQPYSLVRLQSGLGFWFYVGWLLTQVLCGALGAFLSGQAGGSSTARMLAGTFPAIVMFGLWAVWIPVTALFEHNTFVRQHPLNYALGIFVWVLPPGFALLLGAAPFLKEQKPQQV